MTRKEKRELKKQNKAIKDLLKVIKAYFNQLIPNMKNVKDERHGSYTIYNPAELLLPMLMADTMTIGNMRGMTESFNTDICIENFKKLLGSEEISELPHHDTINNFLKKLKNEELEKLKKYMIKQIFKKRSFEKYRFRNNYWLIAVDATGLYSFDKAHCEHCLTQTHVDEETGETTTYYYHNVLEAKLMVGECVFSIGTEFIENESRNISKQDCEIRAFKRLAKRIKKEYPRLPICLLADALYASKPVREICTINNWEYIIRFKKGCSSQITNEYTTIKEMTENIEIKNVEKDEKVYCYEWVNQVSYNEELLNLAELTISGESVNQHFWYMTSFNVTKSNIKNIIKTGRIRWKIENEGFNVQKNHGYELDHIYCHDYNAMKNHYLIIQMAHIIRQIYDHTSETVRQLKLSIKKESLRLLNSLTSHVITIQELYNIQESKTQLRLE